MATNLAIDANLLKEAQIIGGHKTKKATVTDALMEYIKKRKQLTITDLFGKIDYIDDYDYKKTRTRE